MPSTTSAYPGTIAPVSEPIGLHPTERSGFGRFAETLVRIGFLARGLVYAIPGVLALKLALGTHGTAITQTRAIEIIGERHFGHIALACVCVGLVGYVLWGLIRAVLDPLDKGWSVHGIFVRLGYLTSAVAYGGLLAFTVKLLLGDAPHGPTNREWAALLLARPHGGLILGVVALCWIVGGGFVQIASAWRGSFRNDLDLGRVGSGERRAAVTMGRLGLGARGIVFLSVGITLATAALHANPDESRDLVQSVIGLLRQPFGNLLLIAVSLGLIVFSVYSMMCLRWARVRIVRHSVRPGFSPSSR